MSKLDTANAHLAELLRKNGYDTRQEPFASVLGCHKFAPQSETRRLTTIGEAQSWIEGVAREWKQARAERRRLERRSQA